MIKILPPEVANKIAAGEVVERPFSIVKELVENALDAKATRIEVMVEAGGTKVIQVADNGFGMDHNDCQRCLLRHATSKIEKAEDLFSLHTMGFRGEALASIAAVSQFSLVTRKRGEPSGWKIALNERGGPLVNPSAANEGTVVKVANLFCNIPARKKFLKTESTEFVHILRYFNDVALMYPLIEFRLTHQGKEIVHYLPEVLEKRVRAVLSDRMVDQMISLEIQEQGFSVSGFIAKPSLIHATHKHQHLFIQSRPVYDHQVSRAVLDAYATLIPRGYFPAFVLCLHLDPSAVDVNVHPRKSEVRFLNFPEIRSRLVSGIKQALSKADLVPSRAIPMTSSFATRFGYSQPGHSSVSRQYVKSALQFTQDFLGGTRSLMPSRLEELQYRILGQLHRSFIILETPDGIQIFDQHAVSEIVNYHRLMKAREKGNLESQQLLLPIAMEIAAEERHVIEPNLDLLKTLGFDVDFLTEKSLQITAAPSILRNEKIEEDLRSIVEVLKEDRNVDRNEKEHRLLKLEACRSAVMFGDLLTDQEMESLLNQWLEADDKEACEHGRPAVARITVDEMKKFFRR